ncbi:hypothetical protein ACU686_26575 [Yinghuangia aomiensis]
MGSEYDITGTVTIDPPIAATELLERGWRWSLTPRALNPDELTQWVEQRHLDCAASPSPDSPVDSGGRPTHLGTIGVSTSGKQLYVDNFLTSICDAFGGSGHRLVGTLRVDDDERYYRRDADPPYEPERIEFTGDVSNYRYRDRH